MADLLLTGIKVIDLLAPFTKGGKVGLFGGAGVGKTVLITELTKQLGQKQPVILAGLKHTLIEQKGIEAICEGSMMTSVCTHWSHSAQKDIEALKKSVELANQKCLEGAEPVLCVDLSSERIEAATCRKSGRILKQLHPKVTLIVSSNPLSPIPDDFFQSIIFISRPLAELGIYPAVDPLACTSRILSEQPEEHKRVAEQLRRILKESEEAEFYQGQATPKAVKIREALRKPKFELVENPSIEQIIAEVKNAMNK